MFEKLRHFFKKNAHISALMATISFFPFAHAEDRDDALEHILNQNIDRTVLSPEAVRQAAELMQLMSDSPDDPIPSYTNVWEATGKTDTYSPLVDEETESSEYGDTPQTLPAAELKDEEDETNTVESVAICVETTNNVENVISEKTITQNDYSNDVSMVDQPTVATNPSSETNEVPVVLSKTESPVSSPKENNPFFPVSYYEEQERKIAMAMGGLLILGSLVTAVCGFFPKKKRKKHTNERFSQHQPIPQEEPERFNGWIFDAMKVNTSIPQLKQFNADKVAEPEETKEPQPAQNAELPTEVGQLIPADTQREAIVPEDTEQTEQQVPPKVYPERPKQNPEYQEQIIADLNLSKEKDEEKYEKAVRALANNKLKRADLNKRRRALRLEKETASPERQIQIDALLNDISDESKQLSFERRQACASIKEKIKDLRHHYTRELTKLKRLSKKDGLPHSEEIEKINAIKDSLNAYEKKLVSDAKEKAKERAERADYLHGIRLLKEVTKRKKIFDEQIKELKKEKGLKKKEILSENDQLSNEQKIIFQKTTRALHLIKGRSFTKEKLKLTKQLKEALAAGNTELGNALTEQYAAVKEKEKAHVKHAKEIDYVTERIKLLNQKTSERIQKKRDKQKRLEEAHFLQGQRMLYHLRQGLSSKVNTNQISAQMYKEEALKLIGSRINEKFDYPRQRASHLKRETLGCIYLHKREKGLI